MSTVIDNLIRPQVEKYQREQRELRERVGVGAGARTTKVLVQQPQQIQFNVSTYIFMSI